ncbi:CAMK/CAMKL protein kinase [Allomyces macrogynus ATCC 38327]|uniref:CAMK/CAMKL protein kinase n=1 Tax=Allomyces macrogynus (strain ATCC 38327) TaxID=578462 RepID=A0A0L0SKU5_ALLM3|nr:CAMK/CAMKL protein kinase [Allomyces macrogynus ATCC 38327]|eukprot:KNE62995.1 CAMK/CAMKL protein kinase [Allomyces macrogynus ATCC 38327]
MAPPAPSVGPSTIVPAAGDSALPLTPDAVLKDFDMGRSLGSGKFSQVFLVTSKSSQKKYAFKILSKVDHRPKVMEKLRREIDILHRLRGSRLLLPCPTTRDATHVHALQSHPNLVTLHRTFETVTSTILLLEYIPGINLHDFVFESIRLAEPVARGLFRQLVSAVSFCHARGVVHRDIKMGNAMLILCQPPKPPAARETGIAYPAGSANPNVAVRSPATPKHWPRRLELTRSYRLKFRSNIVAEPAGADAHAVATDPRTTCPATSTAAFHQTSMFASAPTIAGRPWMAQEINESGGWLVKLVDFGLGTGYDPDGYRHTAVGSPGYFSPEIARGAEYVGPEVDAWSLGVVLFEMTTGMHPFSAKDLATLKEIVIRGRYAVPPHVSPGLRRTLARLMNVDPRARKSLHMLDEDAWINAQYAESPVYADPDPVVLGKFAAGRRVGGVFLEADVDAVSCDNSSCDGGDEERRERRRRRRRATGVAAVLDDGIPLHEDPEEDEDVEMAEAVAASLSSAAASAVAKSDKLVGADTDDASSTRAEPSRDSMEIVDGDATLTKRPSAAAPAVPMAIPRHERASTAPGKATASSAPTANQPSLPTLEVVGNDTTLTTAVLQEPWVTTSPAHDDIASVHHLATSAYNLLASGPGAAMYEYINVGRPRAATARSAATEPPPSLHEVDMAELPPVPTTAETQAAMAAAAAAAAALEAAKRDGAVALQIATRSTPTTPSRRPARPPTGISKTPGPDRPRTRHHTHHAHERGMPCNAQCMRVARSRSGGRRAEPPVVVVDADEAALAMAEADAAVRELQELRGLADKLRRYNPSMPHLVHAQAQVPNGNEVPGSPVVPRRHGRSRRPKPEGGVYPAAGDAHASSAYPHTHQTAAAAEASAVPYNVSRPTTPARMRQGSMHADPTAVLTHRPVTPAPQLPETTSCVPAAMPTTPAPMALRMRNSAKPAAVAPPNAGGAAGPSASQQQHHAADRDRDRARWGWMPGWWNAQLQVSDASAAVAAPPAGLQQHRGSAGTTATATTTTAATAETMVSPGAEHGSASSSSGSGSGVSKPRWYKRLFSLGSSKDGGAAAAAAAAATAVPSTASNGNGRARARAAN